ncbi:MAG TPA: GntR family transcriptional regulator, partial [Ilumatobacteraceae bacterium]|nr:GntR family transcriptional regulator [Ilumatobacteraceae bacterium]
VTPRTAPPESLSEQAYRDIRRMIVHLELAPGAVIREDALQATLQLGRTPIREALQRLVRDQFVTVMPRRGMYVSSIDVGDLALLYETRAILEPYAMRLACARGTDDAWNDMASLLEGATADATPAALLEIDRGCRELVWRAADNRFLTDHLDMLYAHSDRLWHLYLGDVADLHGMIAEHRAILHALRADDADRAAELIEAHMHHFDQQIRDAVRRRLDSPLAG